MMRVIQQLGWWGLGCCLALTLIGTGCQTPEPQSGFAETFVPVTASTSPPANEPVAATLPGGAVVPAAAVPPRGLDTIGVGDMLTISLKDIPYPQPDIEDRVKDDGTITLIQNQTFTAAGKTRGDLEKEIRDRYVPRFFVSMTVSVRHQKDSQFYFVGGEVRMPNRQVYIGRITVTKAIQSAGDFTDFANKKKVRLTRQNGEVINVNCIEASKDPKRDPEVYPGDKIDVPRKIF